MEKIDELTLTLLPLEMQTYFDNCVKDKDYKFSPKEAQQSLAKTLTQKYINLDDGSSLSPKDVLDRLAIAYTMANPSPQNVKAIYETAGLVAPKQVDVTSDGHSVDALLASLAIRSKDEEEEIHG